MGRVEEVIVQDFSFLRAISANMLGAHDAPHLFNVKVAKEQQIVFVKYKDRCLLKKTSICIAATV